MNGISPDRPRRDLLHGVAAAGLAAAAAGGLGVAGASTAQAATAGSSAATEERNRRFVEKAFDRAARVGSMSSTGDFYDILAEDVVWTVAAVPARTYTSRAEFVAMGSDPVLRRLATPIHPEVQEIHADGDTVVVVWEGTATALDGEPYVNLYAWVFTMREHTVTRVLAFLDLVVLNDLMERVELPA